jgi:hypothetical protein
MEGGDELNRPNFPFQLLEKKEDDACPTSASYPSLDICAAEPNAILPIAEPSKKLPPKHYKKHCKSPRVYSTGYCRHAARWLRVLLYTRPYAAWKQLATCNLYTLPINRVYKLHVYKNTRGQLVFFEKIFLKFFLKKKKKKKKNK